MPSLEGYIYDGPFDSNRKGKKFYIIYHRPDGSTKTIHFGARGMSDYTIHRDKERRDRFWARMSGVRDKNGKKVINNPESPLFWSARLLW